MYVFSFALIVNLAILDESRRYASCDNKAAQAATVVEVRASDEVGLAYKIASVATALRLEITYAKITTEKSDAFDVFT